MFGAPTANLYDSIEDAHTFDLEVPLHPATHSWDDVATLVEGVLADIDRRRRQGRPMAHADVIQALSIAAAVQSARHEASKHLGRGLGLSFQGLSVDTSTAHAG